MGLLPERCNSHSVRFTAQVVCQVRSQTVKLWRPKMARGWESKSVEQQQAEMGDQPKSARRPLSDTQQKLNRKREGLLLSRIGLVRQLEAATHARHRRMLEQSVAEIDRQLAECEQDTPASGV